jgi:hypothetical protein
VGRWAHLEITAACTHPNLFQDFAAKHADAIAPLAGK